VGVIVTAGSDTEDKKHDKMFYFADICAGPGGFTEYVYWRRQQSARGWGFTLRGDHDFRLDKFNSTSPHYNFTPSYGDDDTGNIYSNTNMLHFANKVHGDTGGLGLSMVMADGGDSVDGEFLRQEWLMRRLALCQCCLALLLLREGGNFVCKLFDIFTPFLSDLCYLMTQVFEKTNLHKPLTSRPANSERYLLCLGLKSRRGGMLADYLLHVNGLLDEYPDPPSKKAASRFETITRLAAAHVVPSEWIDYVKDHNLRVGDLQVQFLDETLQFYRDPQLNIDAQQAQVPTTPTYPTYPHATPTHASPRLQHPPHTTAA
jgi:cap1 methyltransferase